MAHKCNQQLIEFRDLPDLQTVARNTIWWGQFNTEHPQFFLKKMATYHYAKWHLKHLLLGTSEVNIYNSNGVISEEVVEIYMNIIRNHPETETTKILEDYLGILEKSEGQRPLDVDDFLKAINNFYSDMLVPRRILTFVCVIDHTQNHHLFLVHLLTIFIFASEHKIYILG